MADTAGIQAALPASTQQNPLQTMSTLQGVVNAQSLNKLYGQELLNKQQELQNTQTTGQQLKQTLSVNQLGALGGWAAGMALSTPTEQLTPDYVRSHIDQARSYLPLMGPQLDAAKGQIADNDTPDALKQKLMNFAMASVHPDVAQRMAGQTGAISTSTPSGAPGIAGTVQPGVGMPNAGKIIQTGPAVATHMTPAEAAQRTVVGRDATGAEQTAPVGAITPTNLGGFGTTGAGASTLPGQATTGLPGDFEYNVKQGVNLNMRADAVPTNKSQLSLLKDDLSRINLIGPGAERDKALNAFVNKYAGFGITMNQAQIAASEGFSKIATQIAMAQAAQSGETDLARTSAMMANPNIDLSKLGNEQILSRLQGNEDYIAAKNQAWNGWKQQHGIGSYAAFAQDFNKTMSPLVFQHEQMHGQDAKDFRTSLGPEGLAHLRAQRELAKKNGWLKPGVE